MLAVSTKKVIRKRLFERGKSMKLRSAFIATMTIFYFGSSLAFAGDARFSAGDRVGDRKGPGTVEEVLTDGRVRVSFDLRGTFAVSEDEIARLEKEGLGFQAGDEVYSWDKKPGQLASYTVEGILSGP